MQKRGTEKAIIIYICLAAVLVLCIVKFDVILAGVSRLWNVVFPLVLGVGMAYVLNIVLVRVERLYFPHSKNRFIQATRRGVGIVVSILLVVALLALVGRLVIPELGKAFAVIGQNIPEVLDSAAEWLEENGTFNASDYLNQIDWNSIMDKIVNVARAGIGSVVNSTISVVGSVVGGVVNFFIGLIFGVYILVGKERLASQAKRIMHAYLRERTVRQITRILETANATFSSFIIGQCTEALILGTLCTVGMMIFDFPYAVMIGSFIGVTALIPIVGAYLGASVGAFMILTVDPLKALLFLVFILVLQQVEGNLIYPRVVGSSIGLPGMWVLAAVTVGGGLLGIGGMLLGVPLAATFYKLFRSSVNERNHRKDERQGKNAPARPPVPARSPAHGRNAAADRRKNEKGR
ncbi:MAG TPA: AI-2E family transporter [Candidatus Eisenbergiella merdipullorum]|uniref:AI-2E family transporter n=1 Tax=Candidatus Eisenbergiella merdipullorum TaxID=2838553 RepID=A0A9D2I7I9_9FIRM|nr:AI-2E family transporter [Candidatus Eisenbergiella merdipullorum]